MVLHWEPVVRQLLEAVSPRVIVEIGSRNGATTTRLLEFAQRHGAVVHAIDPNPGPELDPEALLEAHEGHFVFHEAMSLDALPQIEGIDAALIDGDHNWYTVYNELKLIEKGAVGQQRPFPLVLLHDVDWPYGRRDGYHNPDVIPEEYRHPYEQRGLVPGKADLSDEEGFNVRSNNAMAENTPRNGVRTAAEDFVSDTELELRFDSVAGFFGLGILAAAQVVEENGRLRRLLDDLDSPEFLRAQCETLERARVEAQAQYRAASRRLVTSHERVVDLRDTVASLEKDGAQARERIESLERELENARQAIERLGGVAPTRRV